MHCQLCHCIECPCPVNSVTMDSVENSSESCHDEGSAIEVIEIDIYGIFPKIIDMTSLAALVYTEREWSRGNSQSPYANPLNDEEEGSRLTLAYERLHTMPKTLIDRFAPSLEILDISHNKICNLSFLVHFKNLTSLIADDNLINENTIFPYLPKLRLLWLNHCKIKTLFPWVKKLQQSCPNLNQICLMGNPAAPSYFNGGTFYEYLQYRLFVISLFPKLKHLDDRMVTEDQRAEARRLYKRPLLERLANFRRDEYPIPASMQSKAMERWRMLRHRMAEFFEPTPRANGVNGNAQRNLLI